jgi:type VI secretion system secreted protein VgrG
MPFKQTDRPLKISTPLGDNALLLEGIRGHEAVSELFEFEVDALRNNSDSLVAFDKLLGQQVTAHVKLKSDTRHFNGLVIRLSQERQDAEFTHYRLTLAPRIWLLTKTVRSRIFQQMTVPDILKKVLAGFEVSWEIQGDFKPREYCVQYHESDFNFFSRLAEDEGIYYFFKHTESGHKLVLANTPQSHCDIPFGVSARYEGLDFAPEETRITVWNKAQEIRSGKVTLWDETFQMPYKHLEAEKQIQSSAAAGRSAHTLTLANSQLELYEFPGGYGRRFDGVSKSGGEQSSDLQQIFSDNQRVAGIRMQEEAVGALQVHGASRHAGFTAGHAFSLEGHFSDDGKYALTGVRHEASQPFVADRDDTPFTYKNQFACIPVALPYRPPRRAEAPSVCGVQLGTVVGPGSEEIFPDKFGRVKVQFRWDRDGQNDAGSSCWMRVATPWAGKQWGMIHIPRVGQEVVIDFEEGNVDRPIIVGSVYNADMMPPYALPDNKTQSGVKSRSTPDGSPGNFNEFRFEDKKGAEQIYTHAQWDMLTEVENDETREVRHDRTTRILHDETKTVDNNETITVKQGNQSTTLESGDRSVKLEKGNQSTKLDMGNIDTKVAMGNITTKVDLGSTSEEAMQSIELKVGQSSIKLDQTGVTIKGLTITIEATTQMQLKSLLTQINASAMLEAKGGIVMIN